MLCLLCEDYIRVQKQDQSRITVTWIIYCGLEGLRTSRPNLSLHPGIQTSLNAKEERLQPSSPTAAAACRSYEAAGSLGFQVRSLTGLFSDSSDPPQTPLKEEAAVVLHTRFRCDEAEPTRDWMLLEFKPSSKGLLSYQMLSTAMWNIHHGHGKHSISPEKHQQPVAESHKAVQNMKRAENWSGGKVCGLF